MDDVVCRPLLSMTFGRKEDEVYHIYIYTHEKDKSAHKYVQQSFERSREKSLDHDSCLISTRRSVKKQNRVKEQ